MTNDHTKMEKLFSATSQNTGFSVASILLTHVKSESEGKPWVN